MFTFLLRVFGRQRPPAAIDIVPLPPEPVRAPAEVRTIAQEDRITLPISVRAKARAPAPGQRRSHGPTFTMCYADASGECTERTVHLYNVPKDGAEGFRAHCEMRDADRTFKIARIQWIEGENGQRYEPAAYLNALRANQPPRSPRKRNGPIGEVAS